MNFRCAHCFDVLQEECCGKAAPVKAGLVLAFVAWHLAAPTLLVRADEVIE